MTVIIFLIVIAVLIFVHELGHFLFARACGMRVDAFAIGFGPKIFSYKKGDTLYSLNLIPFGGYVKIFGEDPKAESIIGPDADRSFYNKSKYKKLLVLIGGILFNFIFAWLLYCIVFLSGTTVGKDGFEKYADRFHNSRIMIANVMKGSPADKAGLKAGDIIEQVSATYPNPNNTSKELQRGISAITFIQKTIESSDQVTVSYRNKNNLDLKKEINIFTKGGLIENKKAIGIAMQEVVDLRLPFFSSIYEGTIYTWRVTETTAVNMFDFIVSIFRGTADYNNISGVVGIAGIVGDASSMGLIYLLMIVAIISINLAIINLIPFPALDGGRILFVIIEAIIRRPIPNKIANIVNTVGFLLLVLLMILVTYKDIARIV